MNSDKWTDKELERLEKRIIEQYDKAGKELDKKANDYFSNYKQRWYKEDLARQTSYKSKDDIADEWVKLYGNLVGFEGWYNTANGAYGKTKSQADRNFQEWELAQLGRGQRWNDLKDTMVSRLAEAQKITAGYSNGILPSVYAKASNGIADIAQKSAMEQGVLGIRFDLVDESVVARLMKGAREVRPYRKIDIDLPRINGWNMTKIQNALLQGVLQGDSIDHIADRFQKVVNMNRTQAIRSARTAITGAQSAGKQDRYEALEKQGCVMTKVWVAIDDDRTRPEHAEADGQEVPVDEPFEVGGEELMYPGDMNGSDWNIYNCRCTTRMGNIRFKSILSDKDRKNADIKVVG